MKRPVYVLNGPNLNLLGTREPHIYGHTTLEQVKASCQRVASEQGFVLRFEQSNWEGQLVDWVHEARAEKAAMVINPAGLSFFSVPLLDALKMLTEPVMDVHISNIHKREPLYQKSIMSSAAMGVICGLGPFGYQAALLALADHYAKA